MFRAQLAHRQGAHNCTKHFYATGCSMMDSRKHSHEYCILYTN